VVHHRLKPENHRFLYKIFLFSIDLDELDSLEALHPWFSASRPALYRFVESDHILPRPGEGNLRKQVALYFQDELGTPEPSVIRFVTLPRVCGYVFNPISVYFAYDCEMKPLGALVQVGNTFGEQKLYPVPLGESGFRARHPKHFYVSPFSPLDWSFDFSLGLPGEKLSIRVDDYEGKDKTLMASLKGTKCELTAVRLLWLTLKYPVVTAKVILLIHFEAIRLWWKGVPFFRKEAHPEMQKNVKKPHKSLR
jgi:DUF1365 family protein